MLSFTSGGMLMFDQILKVGIYILAFIASFYCLSGLDLAKVLRKSEVQKAQVLLLLMSLALGYLVGSFLLAIMSKL